MPGRLFVLFIDTISLLWKVCHLSNVIRENQVGVFFSVWCTQTKLLWYPLVYWLNSLQSLDVLMIDDVILSSEGWNFFIVKNWNFFLLMICWFHFCSDLKVSLACSCLTYLIPQKGFLGMEPIKTMFSSLRRVNITAQE